jgi:polyisoprenoid-binding protein YceI
MFGIGTVHATFAVREGDLVVDDSHALAGAEIVLEAASFASNSERRDKDVRGAGLLDVESYPDIVFSAISMVKGDEGWTVPGTVSAHGQTVPVDLDLDRLTAEGSGIRLHGSASHLDRTAFGITGSRGMVGRYLDLEIDAFATPS